MTWEIAFVLGLLAFAIVSFILEKITPDMTAITVFGVLLFVSTLSGSEELPELSSLLGVFSNSAPITVAAMFIISMALEKTGAIDLLTRLLRRVARLPYRYFIPVMALGVGGASAFVNNTPVVIVLLPVMVTLAREMGTPASKLLIPLSYASIFGGACTVLGTSTNLIASGILDEAGHRPLAMFELAYVGVPILIGGTLYLAIFARHLLPNRETISSILSEEERREFLTEAYVRPDSSLIGQSLSSSGLLKGRGVRALEVVRRGVAAPGDPAEIPLQPGDRLVLGCRPSGVAEARSFKGITLAGALSEELETIAADQGALVEALVAPHASITGQTIAEINFRQRFRMVVVAVHRRGQNQRERLRDLRLQEGDTLLMMGSNDAIENLSSSDDLVLLDRPRVPARSLRRKMPLAIGCAAGVVLLATLDIVPIVAAVVLAVACLLVTGCVKPKDAYGAIEWSILAIIFGMLALGEAMEATGASVLIAHGAAEAVGAAVAPDLRPIVLLAVVYIITSLFTEFLSNNAAVALMVPIAISLSGTMDVDPRGFVIAACIASSASFATPIGYQTNTYVFGVGGYRFGDFARVGLPLNAFCFVVTLTVVPMVWPL